MRSLVLHLIRFYQKTISLDHGFVSKFIYKPICIYQPTCSTYTYEAVEKYGVIKGLIIGFRRVLRCHPFAKGGLDPLK